VKKDTSSFDLLKNQFTLSPIISLPKDELKKEPRTTTKSGYEILRIWSANSLFRPKLYSETKKQLKTKEVYDFRHIPISKL